MLPISDDKIVKDLDHAHGTQRVGQHHVEEIPVTHCDRRQFICLADAGVDEQRVQLAAGEPFPQCLYRGKIHDIDVLDIYTPPNLNM